MELTAEDLNNLLNRDDFKKWLESKPPNRVVGYCKSTKACPIAVYLRESGVDDPSITSGTASTAIGKIAIRLPMWAREFVSRLDSREPAGVWITPVLPSESLAVLETCP